MSTETFCILRFFASQWRWPSRRRRSSCSSRRALSDTTSVVWTSPTPSDQSRFTVKPGSQVAFTLTASTTLPDAVVHIAPVDGVLPVGVQLQLLRRRGRSSVLPLRRRLRAGDFKLRFAASAARRTRHPR